MKWILYTWKPVLSYYILALHNLLHSANDISLKNIKMFIEPLQELYDKEQAEKYAEQLLNNEK